MNKNKSQDVTSMLHKSRLLIQAEGKQHSEKGYRDEAGASLALWCQVTDAFKPGTVRKTPVCKKAPDLFFVL